VAVSQTRERHRIGAAIAARGAAVYADFLLPHLRADMIVLDLGCGQATISMGIAETVPNGRVVGIDIDRGILAVTRRDAAAIGHGNLAFAAADGRQLPFRDGAFDAVLCHSMLETLRDPASVVVELRRIIRRGGVIAPRRWSMVASFLAARRRPAHNASMTSANSCGVPRALPNRIPVVACEGCSTRRGLAGLRPPPTTSAMAPAIGLSPLRATGPRNAGIGDYRPRSRGRGSRRRKNSRISRPPGKNGVAILGLSSPSPGVEYWLGHKAKGLKPIVIERDS
jgi:SAM-dependent methyltransferase